MATISMAPNGKHTILIVLFFIVHFFYCYLYIKHSLSMQTNVTEKHFRF
jgi:hypothetical protein